MSNNIQRIAIAFFLAFLLLIIYLSYIVMYQGETLATHPKNSRIWKIEEETIRGGIFDRNGETLAKTVVGQKLQRIYPHKESMVHLVGYASPLFGKTGLEDRYDNYLLGLTGWQKYLNYYFRLAGQRARGYDLHLTIDWKLQEEAYRLLQGRKGAVVALEPKTGAVLALVSSPGFDPNRLQELWPSLLNSEAGPLLNRSIHGLYPPGSTIKIAIAVGALEEDASIWNEVFNNPGYVEVNGQKINDQVVRPSLSMLEGIAFSSNVVFAQIALKMGAEKFYQNLVKLYFTKDIPFDLVVKKSQVPQPRRLNVNALAESGIGQGKLLVTPMHLALITATIANGGVMQAPYLVQRVTTSAGLTVKRTSPSQLANHFSAETARLVTAGMQAAVEWGTATRAAVNGIKVAGKTGSAQNPQGISHAWFAGFAPVDNPQLALAIILENQGAGGSEAAPIAQALFKIALDIKR